MSHDILTVNAGSSSVKLGVFDRDLRSLLRGQVELGPEPRMSLHGPDGTAFPPVPIPAGGDAWLEPALAAIGRHGGAEIAAVGHRIVHGGPDHGGPARVTPELVEALAGLAPLAPLHQGHNVGPIRTLLRLRPELPQFACFDTAFHRTMPDESARFALPRALHDAGVRRYGAHGLSYEFIAGELARTVPALAAGRVVVAHLGSGASLCAMHDGRSVDTTMGMTPLDGLVMGTRCGTLDPGAVLYLLAQGHGPDDLQDMLYHHSGLLGVSARSADMRALHRDPDPACRQAIALFVARLVREVAAMAAAMDGLDGLVFTGGIGEHDPVIRAAACDRLAWLGVALDAAANAAGDARISTAASAVDVRVIATDEERVIARHVRAALETA